MSEEKSAEKHNLIVGAAQLRFARYGYSKVTMDEIAEDIGMGKASLYYYFPTKEDLFRSVLASEQEQFVTHVRSLVAADISPAEKLMDYVKGRFSLFARCLNLSKLNYLSTTEIKPFFADLFREFGGRELEFIRQIIREGKDRNEFIIDDPERISLIFLHLLQGLRLRTMRDSRLRLPEPEDFGELQDEMLACTAIFIRGILRPGVEEHIIQERHNVSKRSGSH